MPSSSDKVQNERDNDKAHKEATKSEGDRISSNDQKAKTSTMADNSNVHDHKTEQETPEKGKQKESIKEPTPPPAQVTKKPVTSPQCIPIDVVLSKWRSAKTYPIVILVRGLPGSGKTRLAKYIKVSSLMG